MTKSLRLSILVSFAFVGQMFAGVVSQQQAASIASLFMNQRMGQLAGFDAANVQINEVSLDGLPGYYVFNYANGGYVLVSAEDAYVPIIGYASQGSFIIENQSADFRSFMENYEHQIRYLRQHGIQADAAISSQWHQYLQGDFVTGDRSVSPLVPSKWNQNYPYNGLCPEDGAGPGGHVYSGCVATAMSQIMYYWRWPIQGTGQHSYYYGSYGNISADFGASTYDWLQMAGSTQVFNYEMAEIQFHCGVAINMMYGPGGSGAYSEDVPEAIISHFGYHPDAVTIHRDNYSTADWEAIVTGQIDAGTPLYYSGCSNSGCHAFVCDGYDNNTPRLFHFNFGWSGQSDGYYTLANAGGFSSWQALVTDFRPVDSYTYNSQAYTEINLLSGSVEDGSGPVKPYTANTEYKWFLNPQQGEDSISSITLKFQRFALGLGDVLKIYNGSDATGSLIGEYTGSSIPGEIVSTGNKLFIDFVTDGTDQGNGWLFEFTTTRPIWCNGLTLYEASEGSFDDGSGNFNYRENSTCMFQIKPENTSEVTVYFDEFDTEPELDFLRVYDGETQALLATFSGTITGSTPMPSITSSNGHLLLVFKTNGNQNHEGWKLHYDSKPVGLTQINSQQGLVLQPNPAKDRVKVLIPSGLKSDGTLTVTNLLGSVLYTESIKNTDATLELTTANFAEGVYFITLTHEGTRTTSKLVISK